MDEGKERSVHTSRRGRVVRPFLSLATYLAILMVLLAATDCAIWWADRKAVWFGFVVGAVCLWGCVWWLWNGLNLLLSWF